MDEVVGKGSWMQPTDRPLNQWADGHLVWNYGSEFVLYVRGRDVLDLYYQGNP